MDVSKVIWLICIYFLLGVAGRYQMNGSKKKIVLMGAIVCKIMIFIFAFFAVFASGIVKISSIFKSGDISNLSATDAAVLIGVLLAVMDIIDSFFEWVDIASGM